MSAETILELKLSVKSRRAVKICAEAVKVTDEPEKVEAEPGKVAAERGKDGDDPETVACEQK